MVVMQIRGERGGGEVGARGAEGEEGERGGAGGCLLLRLFSRLLPPRTPPSPHTTTPIHPSRTSTPAPNRSEPHKTPCPRPRARELRLQPPLRFVDRKKLARFFPSARARAPRQTDRSTPELRVGGRRARAPPSRRRGPAAGHGALRSGRGARAQDARERRRRWRRRRSIVRFFLRPQL